MGLACVVLFPYMYILVQGMMLILHILQVPEQLVLVQRAVKFPAEAIERQPRS